MSESSENTIFLKGSWQANQIGEKLSYLSDRLPACSPRGETDLVLDLSGVTEIDGCGCQLLLLFLQSVKRGGATPVTRGVSSPVRQTMETLGFTPLLPPAAAEPVEAL